MIGGAPTTTPGDIVKDGSDAGFMADVIEASRTTPVIVDFWATWCGPCRQLTPALEKAVLAAKGAVKLVKIDVDKNPRFSGQLRVQSIPTVYAFVDGQPVDGFMGALPDSQVKTFVDRLAKPGGGEPESDVDALLALAREALARGDTDAEGQAYYQVLQLEPGHLKAVAGLARSYLTGGDLQMAATILDMAAPDAKDPELDGVRAALELATEAPSELAPFERRLQADPDDHEARFELAKALAGQGRLDEAVDQLLTIFAKDRDWNEQAARKQLVKIFDAAGPASDVAKTGRRRLSSLMFS